MSGIERQEQAAEDGAGKGRVKRIRAKPADDTPAGKREEGSGERRARAEAGGKKKREDQGRRKGRPVSKVRLFVFQKEENRFGRGQAGQHRAGGGKGFQRTAD